MDENNLIGKKIRLYREYRKYTQVQLAELSGINVGTIRKYELGIRKPKQEQLSKIAAALKINLSAFYDLEIHTVGDVLSLLFAIDDATDLTLSYVCDDKTDAESVAFSFKNIHMQEYLINWCVTKHKYEEEKAGIMKIEDDDLREDLLELLEERYLKWKTAATGNYISAHALVKKGIHGVDGLSYEIPKFE